MLTCPRHVLQHHAARFSHEIHFIKWRGGREARGVLMAAVGGVADGTPTVMPMLGYGSMVPHVMPNDPELFAWVADAIVDKIGGATLGTCALEVAAGILGPHTGARTAHGKGGHVLLLCDGSEFYSRELHPAQCLPVVEAALARVGSPVCVSALGLGSHARLTWLGALARSAGGTLAVAHDETALGDALAELVRTFTLRRRCITFAGCESRVNATLGTIRHVHKAAGDVDVIDVTVFSQTTPDGATIAVPVRDASPAETAYVLAASLARKFLAAMAAKAVPVDELAGTFLGLVDARVAEVTSMVAAKEAGSGLAYIVKVRCAGLI